jgi:hypothetical protein
MPHEHLCGLGEEGNMRSPAPMLLVTELRERVGYRHTVPACHSFPDDGSQGETLSGSLES